MTQRAAVSAIIAATLALTACGVSSPDADDIRAADEAPPLLVELQSLPHGHPPVPGYAVPRSLPEGHPPVPGLRSAPALPDGHPRCPARGLTEPPQSEAGPEQALQDPAVLIST